MIVAVDGPAGSGKSSVCRGAAQAAHARYLDTGAMYRAMTWAVLSAGIDPLDTAAVTACVDRVTLDSSTDPTNPTIWVDGVDVTAPIRSDQVTAAVSAVSAIPQVRTQLVAKQRSIVSEAIRDGVDIIVEGRDIGSVVLPDADVKIFLTADPAERARRRAKENHGAEIGVDHTKQALLERDHKDSNRAISPLTKADDAIELDTTDLSLDEVIAEVLTAMGIRT